MFEEAPIGDISIYYVILLAAFAWLAHKIDANKKESNTNNLIAKWGSACDSLVFLFYLVCTKII